MTKITNQHILQEIHSLSHPDKIGFYTKFFRAQKGDICEGDKLLAIPVPEVRKLVTKYYKELTLEQIIPFLESEYNDVRFFGQQIIVTKYRKAQSMDEKYEFLQFLKKHINSVNHWNLVDTTADAIFGNFALLSGDYSIILEFANSNSMWQKRIAIVACQYLVKNKIFQPFLTICEQHLTYPHEYIHKANGWILREVGKKDEQTLINFLKKHWKNIPSVTRRYATEKLRQIWDIKVLFGK